MSWGVEEMGESAFHFCDALAHMHIPASVTIIGKLAFAGCSSLSEISVPGSVRTLGDYAFGDCDSLERLLVDEGVLVTKTMVRFEDLSIFDENLDTRVFEM